MKTKVTEFDAKNRRDKDIQQSRQTCTRPPWKIKDCNIKDEPQGVISFKHSFPQAYKIVFSMFDIEIVVGVNKYHNV